MRSLSVVPFDPLSDRALCLDEAFKLVLPDALLFETTEKPFDDSILLGHVRCDELLTQVGFFLARGKAGLEFLRKMRRTDPFEILTL